MFAFHHGGRASHVDVCTELVAPLKAFVEGRRSGLLFANKSGKPLSQTKPLPKQNSVRAFLHPLADVELI